MNYVSVRKLRGTGVAPAVRGLFPSHRGSSAGPRVLWHVLGHHPGMADVIEAAHLHVEGLLAIMELDQDCLYALQDSRRRVVIAYRDAGSARLAVAQMGYGSETAEERDALLISDLGEEGVKSYFPWNCSQSQL